jgi:6-phosphogluconolactonase
VHSIGELVDRSVRAVAGVLAVLVGVGLGAELLAPSVAVAGNTVYASDWAQGAVSTFSIGAGGSLTQQGTGTTSGSSPSSQPSGETTSPSGQELYVANEAQATVSTFSIDAGGALIPQGTPVSTGSSSSKPFGVAVPPDGLNLYVANYGDGTVATFSIGAGGALTPQGTPVSTGSGSGSGAGWLAVSPTGRTLYVTNYNQGTVSTFSIGAGGALTPQGAPVSTGSTSSPSNPERLAISPSGLDLYVANAGQSTVSTFSIGAGGALTQQGTPVSTGSGAGATPEGVAISPNGQDLYVSNEGQSTVSAFSIGAGGVLTQQGTPLTTGSSTTSQPYGLAVSPDGEELYVANFAPGTLSTFSIGAGGALTPQGTPTTSGSSTVSQPYDVAVSPDQGPSAAYSATAAPAGSSSAFNAQASVAGTTPIATYAWRFGDGDTETTAGPVVNHVFETPGRYTVTLTLIDSDACSVIGPFTGHSAYCAPDPAAITSQTITVPALASASHDSLTGVAKRKPRLAFTLAAGASVQPLQTIAVSLPAGLSFSSKKKSLAHDVTIKGAKGRRLRFTAKVSHGVLEITLKTASAKAQVAITSPELSATKGLTNKVKKSEAGKHRKPVKLTIKLDVTDTQHNSAGLSLKLTAR